MAPIYRRRATNAMPDPFAQLDDYGANCDGINKPDTSKNSINIRGNNANAQQYPYPLSSVPINHGPESPAATQASYQTPYNSMNIQGEAGAQTFVQAAQSPIAQSNSNLVTGSSTISVSSISSSTSPSSTRLTSTGSTLGIPPPRSMSLSESTNPPSLTFLSQSFSDIDSSAPTTSLSTSDDTAPTSSIQISSTGVILLISLGGLILVTTLVCIVRCGLRQWRHNRRRRKQSAFDFSRQAGKGSWDGEKSGVLGGRSGIEAGRSPSTIFGGQERTGLTPQPSWTTFHEGERSDIAAATSPYPLGLLPPPASHLQVGRYGGPAALTALGISHPGFPSRLNGSPRNISQPYPPLNRLLEPPRITITNSSPRQSGHELRCASNGSQVPPPLASANDGISPVNSYNRVGVYTHPENGAQLVKPPRLMLANDDPLLSESDAGPRQSGWSSWDDNIGVELGVRIDRRNLPPKRKSRIPVSKPKVAVSPLRITLAPVMEISDSDGNLTKPSSSSKSPTSPNLSLHPNSLNSRLRHGPSSPSSPLRRSPRSMKSTSPRAGKSAGKQAAPRQRLYALPQFEATSPNSMRVASPASPLPSPSTAYSASNSPMPIDGGGSQKRKSRRVSSRPVNEDRPASTVSETLSDAYAYVYEYARDLSSTESEEIQIRWTSKRGSRSSKIDGDRLGGGRAKGNVEHSPAVRDTIGALMMKGYEEEGAITSPSMPWLWEKREHGGAGGKLPGGGGRKLFGEINANCATPGAMRLHGLGISTKDQRRSRDQIRQKQQQQPRQRRSHNTPAGPPESPPSVYSEYPGHQQQFQQQQQHQQRQEARGVPSLPPVGMPNLHQLRLMREMPDYRSPTYSMYGMYREDGNGNRASPLVPPPPSPSPSPLPSAASVQYRYASASGTGRTAWRVDVI